MHMFPGCEILRSWDLAHWEYCSCVYQQLDSTAAQRLDKGAIYGKGMWAGSLRIHKGVFHILFICHDTHQSYHFSASVPEGPWMRHDINGFYYDPSLLFDGDRVYVAHGNRQIWVTELTGDLSQQNRAD